MMYSHAMISAHVKGMRKFNTYDGVVRRAQGPAYTNEKSGIRFPARAKDKKLYLYVVSNLLIQMLHENNYDVM